MYMVGIRKAIEKQNLMKKQSKLCGIIRFVSVPNPSRSGPMPSHPIPCRASQKNSTPTRSTVYTRGCMPCHAMPCPGVSSLPFPSFPSAPSLTRPPSPHNISILSSALRLNNRLYLFLSSPLPHINLLASPLTTVLGSNTGSSSSSASITARTCSPISSILVLRGK